MLEHTSSGEVARRLQLREADSSSWIAIVGFTDRPKERLAFAEDLSILIPSHVREVDLDSLLSSDPAPILQIPSDDLVVVFATRGFQCDKWKQVDLKRSMLERQGPLIFWLTEKESLLLADCAPNIRSYIGISIFKNYPDSIYMSEPEIEERLMQLRRRFGLSDAEVIQRAE